MRARRRNATTTTTTATAASASNHHSHGGTPELPLSGVGVPDGVPVSAGVVVVGDPVSLGETVVDWAGRAGDDAVGLGAVDEAPSGPGVAPVVWVVDPPVGPAELGAVLVTRPAVVVAVRVVCADDAAAEETSAVAVGCLVGCSGVRENVGDKVAVGRDGGDSVGEGRGSVTDGGDRVIEGRAVGKGPGAPPQDVSRTAHRTTTLEMSMIVAGTPWRSPSADR